MLITQLSKHLETTDVTITLTKVGDLISAIVVPKPKNDKISMLKPIVATGTAEELDENLANALTSVFEKISSFRISGVKEVEEQIEKASKEEKPKKATTTAESKEVKPKEVKENPKQLFDKAQALFKEAKYMDALPIYKQAFDLKPDSKQYKEAFELCEKWVNRIKEVDLFKEAEPKIDSTIDKKVEIIDAAPNNTFEEEDFTEEEVIEEATDEDDFSL